MRDDAAAPPRQAAQRGRIAMIVNPAAGRHRRFARALALLSGGGVAVRLLPTGARGDAERLAAEAASSGQADAIVAAGGDGTINEVINGMAGSGLPLGILPLGTANVLAWELGIGDRLADAAAVIAGRATRRIHLGRCNGRYFVMMAGVGVDAHVVAAIRPGLKRALGRVGLGKLTYVLEGFNQIARLQPRRYRVTVDGVAADAASAIVANGRFYAGRYVIAPDADLGAPLLQTCLFARSGRLQAVRNSLAMLAHRLHRSPDLTVRPGTAITIDGPPGDPIQADGDIIGRLPAVIDLAPTTLDIFAPR
jgi:YegS/Rv2252/BmrU family lipid kinase